MTNHSQSFPVTLRVTLAEFGGVVGTRGPHKHTVARVRRSVYETLQWLKLRLARRRTGGPRSERGPWVVVSRMGVSCLVLSCGPHKRVFRVSEVSADEQTREKICDGWIRRALGRRRRPQRADVASNYCDEMLGDCSELFP